MALSPETQRWLDGLKATGKISTEDLAVIARSVDVPEANEYIKGNQLRQDDYSRNMATLKEATTALETAKTAQATREAQITQYQLDVTNWKVGAEGKLKAAVEAAETSAQKVALATQRVKSAALAAGIDEKEFLKGLEDGTVTDPNAPGVKGPDMSKYLTQEQLAQSVRGAAQESALLDATIHDLDVSYQTLFGTRLNNAAELVQEAIKAGQPLKQYVETKYNFAGKRQEAATAETQKKIDEGILAGVTKWQSEHQLAPGQQAGIGQPGFSPNSPIFKNPNLTKPVDTSQGERRGGVEAAIAAAQAGKYAGGVVHNS